MADLDATMDALARPLAEEAGLDLVDVQVRGSGSRTKIKVVVDRKGGVDITACQELSRRIGRALDDLDPLAQRYTLEVTSPGTDHPLGDRRAFDRVEGKRVKAVISAGDTATREIAGIVTAAGPEAAELTDDDGMVHPVPYDRIITAAQELPW
jgi:ribosome maturation factor RimP